MPTLIDYIREDEISCLIAALENPNRTISDDEIKEAWLLAAAIGNVYIGRLLLPFVDINVPEHPVTGETALYIALQQSKIPYVRFLLNNGANVNVVTDSTTQFDGTPLILAAIRSGQSQDHSIYTKCLNNGARVNLANSRGETALHAAVVFKSIYCIKSLLENGADPTIKAHGLIKAADYGPREDYLLETKLIKEHPYLIANAARVHMIKQIPALGLSPVFTNIYQHLLEAYGVQKTEAECHDAIINFLPGLRLRLKQTQLDKDAAAQCQIT